MPRPPGPLATFFALTLSAAAARAAPEATSLYPSGGQQGQCVAVSLGGKFSSWPPQFWVDRPEVRVAPLEKPGEIEIRIAPDAEPGLYWIRAYDATGAATPLPFAVGTIREVSEVEPNDALADAQPCQRLEESLLVNGRLDKAGDVDVYALPLQAGQTLVADVDAQALLGSPVDCVVQLVSPEGFVAAQAEDHQGLDPRLVARIDREGVWRIRVFGFPETPNQTIGLAGGDDYVYRLTLTVGAFADFTLPMALERGASGAVELRGWNLPPELARSAFAAGDGPHVLAHPALANTLRLPVTPHPSITLDGAANEPREVALPVTITGVLGEAGRRDRVTFRVKQGQTVSTHIESRALGFDLDPVLELFDSAGASVARVDDGPGSRDARLAYQAAADGPLTLAVSDLHGGGGPRYAYRLTLEPAAPDFRAVCGEHQAVLERGASLELPISIERVSGHADPIRVVAEGLPPGVSCEEAESVAGDDSASKIALKLAATADAPLASAPVRIMARDEHGLARSVCIPLRVSDAELVDLWFTVRDATTKP